MEATNRPPLRALRVMFMPGRKEQHVHRSMMELAIVHWRPNHPRISLERLRNMCLHTGEESMEAFMAFLLAYLIL